MLRSAPEQQAARLDDYRWLTSAAAVAGLEQLAATAKPLPGAVEQLRRQLTPARTHLLLEQVALRRRARAKFAAAERMFFTALGLEQATDEVVAEYKARRFAGSSQVLDLCTGVGGDLMALARVAPTTGVERDPAIALLAEVNAGLDGAASVTPRVLARDVADVDVGDCAAWHVDPDRRPSGGRTTRVELHEPPVEILERLLARNAHAAIKLAPAAEVPAAWAEGAECEWIGRDRQCRQLVVWFGELTRHASQRRATVLMPGAPPRSVVGRAFDEQSAVDRVGRYLLEPDAAVLAAGLGATLAAEHQLDRVTAGIAYWTGDRRIDDPALGCFEVCEVLPLDMKRVKALVRARNIGTLEVKKRGVECDPAALRRQLEPRGDVAGTLIVTRVAGRVMAILARRLTSQAPP